MGPRQSLILPPRTAGRISEGCWRLGLDPKGKLGKNPRGVHVRICLHPGVILEITGNTACLGFDYRDASRDLGLIKVISDGKESCQ